jgi:hypothetical protein
MNVFSQKRWLRVTLNVALAALVVAPVYAASTIGINIGN